MRPRVGRRRYSLPVRATRRPSRRRTTRTDTPCELSGVFSVRDGVYEFTIGPSITAPLADVPIYRSGPHAFRSAVARGPDGYDSCPPGARPRWRGPRASVPRRLSAVMLRDARRAYPNAARGRPEIFFLEITRAALVGVSTKTDGRSFVYRRR